MPVDLQITALEAALARFAQRSPVASLLRTAEWAEVPEALRSRAFFSAAVEDARLLQSMRDRIASDLALDPSAAYQGRDAFIADMRRQLGAPAGDTAALTDIGSYRRLGLIYDMNVEEAREFARHKTSQAPALLDAFPARELIRLEGRKDERDWPAIWQAAGGTLYAGRMVALVNDPIWSAISRFGRPYPPFDFGSGMGLATVERPEAERLGVIAPGETPAPEEPLYNSSAQSADPGLDTDLRSAIIAALAGRVRFEEGRIRLV